MRWKKLLISSVIGTSLFMGSMVMGYGETLTYQVKSGDTFWIISQKFDVSIESLMKGNNANEYTVLYPGDSLIIPNNIQEETIYTVQSGDTYWKISEKYGVDLEELMEYNGHNQYTMLYIGQNIKIPPTSTTPVSNTVENSSGPYVTYISHKVRSGDDFWKISLKYGIPMYELLNVNHMNENTILYIGDTLKIPVHHVPVKNTPGSQYGEYLDWWTEAQYVIPIGTQFKVMDYYTGKTWNMKRTIGANHADCEPLTKTDTSIMKSVWGGNFSWDTRPVLIEYGGRKIAASAASMPHSIQYITNNDFDGHMDIHFAGSTRHKDGETDWNHQKNIKISAGLK